MMISDSGLCFWATLYVNVNVFAATRGRDWVQMTQSVLQ